MSIYSVERSITFGKSVVVGKLGRELSKPGPFATDLHDEKYGDFFLVTTGDTILFIRDKTSGQILNTLRFKGEEINSSEFRDMIRYNPSRFQTGKKILLGCVLPF